jgi:hypothetical protein
MSNTVRRDWMIAVGMRTARFEGSAAILSSAPFATSTGRTLRRGSVPICASIPCSTVRVQPR